jgi:ATP-binding cassette, subfamily B, multidrug efflux pump
MSATSSTGSATREKALGKAYDSRLMRRLWTYVRPHKGLLLLSLLLLPITVGFELAQPYVLMIAIDQHIAARSLEGLGPLALLYLGLVGAQAAAMYGQIMLLQLLGQRAMHDLRLHTYDHVLEQRAAFFDRMPVGRLLTRMTNDVENLNEMFSISVTLISDLVKLVAIVAIMLALDVKLTLMTFLVLPVLLVVVEYARRLMRRSFREIRVKVAAMNTYLQEHLGGLKIVQMLGREQRASERYDRINADHRDAYFDAIRADSVMYALVEAIGVCAAAIIAWYAGAHIGQVGQTVLTIGLVVAFIEYVNKFFIPIRDLSAKYTVMQQAMAATERIAELLDTDEPDAAARGVLEPARDSARGGAPAVAFRDVRFGYREGERVLEGLSFEVPRGATVAVVGATGSGKSTLIKLLTRLYEATEGTIELDGVDIRALPVDELRRRVTVIAQDVFLFAGTVADNVALARPGADRAAIDAALERAGALPILARRAAGADTAVAERGQNFSAGERQVLAFARALLRDPDVLVLDEATAHVDPETEQAIERGLEVLTQERTTLMIAHRLSTIRDADYIVVLDRGRVAEQGTREQLLAKGGLYARLEQTFEAS